MRRLAALLALTTSALAGAAQEKFAFSIAGQSAGTATLSFTKLADGGTKFAVDLKFDFGGQTGHQVQEDVYDKNGKPKSSTTLSEQGENKVQEKIVFGIASLTHTTITNGKSKEKTVKYPVGKSIVKLSQLWFFITKPAAHAAVTEIDYETKSGNWVSHKRTYVGPTQIEIGGKKVNAFEIQDKNLTAGTVDTQWVDAQGMPYRAEFQSSGTSMTLERVAS
jgi:hypothetical protein